jgi:competence protein ComEC
MSHSRTESIPYPAFPGFRLMIFLAAGIVISSYTEPSLWITAALFSTLLVAWFAAEFLIKRIIPLFAIHTSILFYLVLISAFGFTLHELQENKREKNVSIGDKLNLFAWEEIEIKGEVEATSRNNEGVERYTVKVSHTVLPGEVVLKKRYRIRLYADGLHGGHVTPGMAIHGLVTLYGFPDRRNPHEFDYGNWLHKNSIAAHGGLDELLNTTSEDGISWDFFRNKIRNNIDIAFSEQAAPLAKALLLGYKEDLHPETETYFSRSGLSHIMAVSGLHVGFIVAPFWLLIPFLWNIKHGKWFGLIGLTLLLLFYAGITGFSPSVTRASLMAWFLTYGRLFHRVRNSINLTAVAAILILIADPAQLFTVGFQLSFSAVFVILFVMPRVTNMVPPRYRFGLKGGLITIVLVSFVVQAGLFPILVYYFGEFSIIGPVANTLVLPLMSFLVPAGLVVSLLPVTDGSILQSGSFIIGFGLQWIELVASTLGSNAYTYITINEFPASLFGCWLFAVGFIATIHKPGIRWKMLVGLLLFVNLCFVELIIKKQSNIGRLEVTALDVGQGDAIHVKTPQNHHILIDSGRWTPGSNSGERIIVPYLKEKGIEALDAVILTHPHADHIGGMLSIAENIKIKAVYQSDFRYDSQLYQNLQRVLSKNNIAVHYPSAGDIIRVDPSIRIFVVGPATGMVGNNPNNHSLSFKLTYGETSFLFTGDAEKEQEREMVKRYGEFLQSNVYKVAHHGSSTSSGEFFIKAVKPTISIGSLAFRNKFGHPGRQTVTRLHNVGTDQYYTSLNGAVILESDGRTVTKINWKE